MANVSFNKRVLGSGEERWRVQWRLDGRQGSRTFTDEASARHWENILVTVGVRTGLALLENAETADTVLDGAKTIEWIVREHVRVRSGITPGTRGSYLREAERDIFPTLGAQLGIALTEDEVAVWINGLEAKGLAAKTIKNRHGLLSQSLGWAAKAGHVPGNVARGVPLPKGVKVEMTFLEDYEVAELLTVLANFDARWVDLVLVLVGTGMRWGEATALLMRDIVFTPSGATIKVTKAWKDVHSGKPTVGPPKTRKGVRTIPLTAPNPVIDALRRQMALRSSGADLLFQSPEGCMVRNGEFHDRVWTPLRKKLAAEYGWHKSPRIHDLRHTAASLMLAANVEVHAVSEILGHEKTSTTQDVYGHLRKGAREQATTALGAALAAAVPPVRRLTAV